MLRACVIIVALPSAHHVLVAAARLLLAVLSCQSPLDRQRQHVVDCIIENSGHCPAIPYNSPKS